MPFFHFSIGPSSHGLVFAQRMDTILSALMANNCLQIALDCSATAIVWLQKSNVIYFCTEQGSCFEFRCQVTANLVLHENRSPSVFLLCAAKKCAKREVFCAAF